jgi:hypothetical protein
MSSFKCGLRRFDGHGTSSYRPSNTEASKEMESAYSKMMRLREQQDAGNFSLKTIDEIKTVIPEVVNISKKEERIEGPTYSLSDAK